MQDIDESHCHALYGPGVCEQDLSAADMENIKKMKRRLWAASKLQPPANASDDIEYLRLYALEDPSTHHIRVLLFCFSLYAPVQHTLWECKLAGDTSVVPMAGSVIFVPLDLQFVFTEVSVAMWLFRQANIRWWQICYEWSSLDALLVIGCIVA